MPHLLLPGCCGCLDVHGAQVIDGLYIRKDGKGSYYKLLYQSVDCAEVQQNYVFFLHRVPVSMLSNTMLKKGEQQLPAPAFMRVHNPWMVRLGAITHVEGNMLTLAGGRQVPVGTSYKDKLLAALNITG